MDARDFIQIGMSAERMLVVPPDRTVGHFVPHMPMVYATPMMILEMELTSGDAIRGKLQAGWVTVGTEVNVRHLAAAMVGAVIGVVGRASTSTDARRSSIAATSAVRRRMALI